MTTNADVTVAEVIEAARRKRALLTAETAGYLVLEAADQLASSPVMVDEHLCSMQVEGGGVSLLSRRVAHPLDAERSLRQLLRRLLDVSSGRAPALNNVASLPAKGDLAALVGELESALIPLNRSAAARALSRLARETVRERRPSFAPGEAPPPIDIGQEAESVPPGPGDDTEPMQVAVDVGPVFDMSRDSQDTLNRYVGAIKPASDAEGDVLPRFPLDSSNERQGRSSDAPGFFEEVTNVRGQTIEARASLPSADGVQDLLDDCRPSSPPSSADAPPPAVLPPPTPPPPRAATPPPPAAARTPAPAAAASSPLSPAVAPRTVPPASAPQKTPAPPTAAPMRTPTPAPTALPAVATSSSAAAPKSAASARSAEAPPDPIDSSFPPPSARGVDELLHDFLSSSSRKQDRVAQDLRKMAGVDPGATPSPAAAADASRDESPFPHAGGATDFYTSTPPPRAAVSGLRHEDHVTAPPKRRGVYAMFAVIILAASGGIALLRFEPGFLSGRMPSVVAEEQRAAAEAASTLIAHPPQVCRATVVVTDVPAGSEVLLRSGVAPVDVERVPAGARLEFVALAEGYTPRRGVVPQGAPWDAPNGRPRFELPIQLEKSRSKAGTLDPWPTAEPGTVVGGQGAPGTVHVVTSPRGAEVWMVAGGAPEAKLESMPCGAALEIMVVGMQQGQPLRRRLQLDAARLTPEPSASAVTARISAAK